MYNVLVRLGAAIAQRLKIPAGEQRETASHYTSTENKCRRATNCVSASMHVYNCIISAHLKALAKPNLEANVDFTRNDYSMKTVHRSLKPLLCHQQVCAALKCVY